MLSASGGLDNLKTAYKDTANALTNTAGVKILFIYNGIYSPYAYLTNDGRIFVSQDTSVKNDRAIVMVVSSSNELLSTTVVKM